MQTITVETERGVYVYESTVVPSKGDTIKLLDTDEIYVLSVSYFPQLQKVSLRGTFEKPVAKTKK